jgi:hypothetical protein
MADLGELVGSLMCGLVRARRMADEQTAALAEYYSNTPLLEGLSVPRIRIPELTIDMPVLIDGFTSGTVGQMQTPAKIAAAANAQLTATLTKNKMKLSPSFHKEFIREVTSQLKAIQESGRPAMEEAVARTVQNAFADTLARTRAGVTGAERETIARDLRNEASRMAIVSEPVAPGIGANVKTADVKEQSSAATAVRLTITLKEEGLEWAVQSSDTGGVIRTLQPE